MMVRRLIVCFMRSIVVLLYLRENNNFLSPFDFIFLDFFLYQKKYNFLFHFFSSPANFLLIKKNVTKNFHFHFFVFAFLLGSWCCLYCLWICVGANGAKIKKLKLLQVEKMTFPERCSFVYCMLPSKRIR